MTQQTTNAARPASAKLAQTLALASPSQVSTGAAKLYRDLGGGGWLDKSNPLLAGLESFLLTRGKALSASADDFAYFVASSAPLHCLDSCRYLGRALASLNRGDWRTATHLGYYSEIRSAMSILATQGFAVGGRRHAVFPATGSPLPIKDLGTHLFVWQALDAWSGTEHAVDLLNAIIRPGSIGLKDWFAAADPSISPGSQICKQWFGAWGVDLAKLSSDREARNEVSYRPSGIIAFPGVKISTGTRFLTQIWTAFEPSSDAQFPNLDTQLLRQGLLSWRAETKGTQRTPGTQKARMEYRRFLDDVLSRVRPVGHSTAEWRSLLKPPSHLRTRELLERAADPQSSGPSGCFNVLSRAALLLRIALGASSDLLRHAGVNKSRFVDWLGEIAVDCGFVDSMTSINSMSDMWSDVKADISALSATTIVPGPSTKSRFSWLDRVARPGFSLTGIERIGLWGLEP